MSWRYEPTATGIVRQVIAPSMLELLLWLLVLSAVGWLRAVGLVVGSASPWGIVPLGLFGFGVVLCRIRASTGSLLFPTAVHVLHNLTTVEVVVWAFPGEQAPQAFTLLNAGVNGMGMLLAIGLVIRTALPRPKRDLLLVRVLAGGGRALG